MTATPQDVSVGSPTVAGKLKNMALFLASPFVGLFYAVLLPGKLYQLAMRDMKANTPAGDKASRP